MNAPQHHPQLEYRSLTQFFDIWDIKRLEERRRQREYLNLSYEPVLSSNLYYHSNGLCWAQLMVTKEHTKNLKVKNFTTIKISFHNLFSKSGGPRKEKYFIDLDDDLDDEQRAEDYESQSVECDDDERPLSYRGFVFACSENSINVCLFQKLKESELPRGLSLSDLPKAYENQLCKLTVVHSDPHMNACRALIPVILCSREFTDARNLLNTLIHHIPSRFIRDNSIQINFDSFPFNLNSTQKELMLLCIRKNIYGIHGPPGSGKTRFGSSLAFIYKEQFLAPGKKVIILTKSNQAAEEAVSKFMDINYVPLFLTSNERQFQQSLKKEFINLVSSDIGHHNPKIAEDFVDPKPSTLLGHIIAKPHNYQLWKKKQSGMMNAKDINEWENLVKEETRSIIKNTPIIVSTMGNISKYIMRRGDTYGRDLINSIDMIILDEAFQITDFELTLPCIMQPKHLILIGDPKQLNPIFLSKSIQTNPLLSKSMMAKRLKRFEEQPRRLRQEIGMFKESYRLTKDLVDLVSGMFYNNQLVSAHPNTSILDIVPEHEKVNVPSWLSKSSIIFIHVEGATMQAGSSRLNIQEALLTNEVLKSLQQLSVDDSSIGVISLYQAHCSYLKQERSIERSYHIGTVDSYQGTEKDFIILNTVISDGDHVDPRFTKSLKTGVQLDMDSPFDADIAEFNHVKITKLNPFLSNINRSLVALTRSKNLLIIIGNARTLTQIPMWKCILAELNRNLCVMQSVPNFHHDFEKFVPLDIEDYISGFNQTVTHAVEEPQLVLSREERDLMQRIQPTRPFLLESNNCHIERPEFIQNPGIIIRQHQLEYRFYEAPSYLVGNKYEYNPNLFDECITIRFSTHLLDVISLCFAIRAHFQHEIDRIWVDNHTNIFIRVLRAQLIRILHVLMSNFIYASSMTTSHSYLTHRTHPQPEEDPRNYSLLYRNYDEDIEKMESRGLNTIRCILMKKWYEAKFKFHEVIISHLNEYVGVQSVTSRTIEFKKVLGDYKVGDETEAIFIEAIDTPSALRIYRDILELTGLVYSKPVGNNNFIVGNDKRKANTSPRPKVRSSHGWGIAPNLPTSMNWDSKFTSPSVISPGSTRRGSTSTQDPWPIFQSPSHNRPIQPNRQSRRTSTSSIFSSSAQNWSEWPTNENDQIPDNNDSTSNWEEFDSSGRFSNH